MILFWQHFLALFSNFIYFLFHKIFQAKIWTDLVDSRADEVTWVDFLMSYFMKKLVVSFFGTLSISKFCGFRPIDSDLFSYRYTPLPPQYSTENILLVFGNYTNCIYRDSRIRTVGKIYTPIFSFFRKRIVNIAY